MTTHPTAAELRQNVLTRARRVVIKTGTQLLTRPDGTLDLPFMAKMAAQVVALRNRGFQVTCVTSGAIGAGCAELGMKSRPKDVADQQAVAAVGQRRLMTHLHEVYEPHGLRVGQLLLTRSDFEDRARFLNIRNCVNKLHELGCVPIINENDTVAVDEIRFGDNDLLAALMCSAVEADALVILSVVDGLLDGDKKRIEFVTNVRDVAGMATGEKSKLGTGGMVTKLEAARLVTHAGQVAVVANGREPEILLKVFGGQDVGTLFAPRGKKLPSRERWIGLTRKPVGTISVDAGAANALVNLGKSLLASGITATEGKFAPGQVVSVRDVDGHEVARGLTNFSSEELTLISGKKSSQLEKILGRPAHGEVIHRDNLVVHA